MSTSAVRTLASINADTHSYCAFQDLPDSQAFHLRTQRRSMSYIVTSLTTLPRKLSWNRKRTTAATTDDDLLISGRDTRGFLSIATDVANGEFSLPIPEEEEELPPLLPKDSINTLKHTKKAARWVYRVPHHRTRYSQVEPDPSPDEPVPNDMSEVSSLLPPPAAPQRSDSAVSVSFKFPSMISRKNSATLSKAAEIFQLTNVEECSDVGRADLSQYASSSTGFLHDCQDSDV
ncbi:hypothetical protein SeLEV6574_g05181 [Synchytrium endobioticum]|nr:hypothetical protein SeLEV6574_g05181 [Synchytrium endobioticum]